MSTAALDQTGSKVVRFAIGFTVGFFSTVVLAGLALFAGPLFPLLSSVVVVGELVTALVLMSTRHPKRFVGLGLIAGLASGLPFLSIVFGLLIAQIWAANALN